MRLLVVFVQSHRNAVARHAACVIADPLNVRVAVLTPDAIDALNLRADFLGEASRLPVVRTLIRDSETGGNGGQGPFGVENLSEWGLHL